MQKNYKIDLIEKPISNFLEVLNDLYLPLISKKALNLYIFYLSNDKKIFLNLKFKKKMKLIVMNYL